MDWDREKRKYLDELFAKTGLRLQLERSGSKWARGSSGSLAILPSKEHPGPQWFFGLTESEFTRRPALGLVLLCQEGQDLNSFPLPARQVRQFLPTLKPDKKGEKKLHLFLRHGRYVLPVSGRPDVDLTPFKGDLSWLSGTASPTVGEGSPVTPQLRANSEPPTQEPALAFFARVRRGRLEPIDPTSLPEGDVLLVRVSQATAVPASAALRRIVARGGPRSLPEDLADEHDHYAHGSVRRN